MDPPAPPSIGLGRGMGARGILLRQALQLVTSEEHTPGCVPTSQPPPAAAAPPGAPRIGLGRGSQLGLVTAAAPTPSPAVEINMFQQQADESSNAPKGLGRGLGLGRARARPLTEETVAPAPAPGIPLAPEAATPRPSNLGRGLFGRGASAAAPSVSHVEEDMSRLEITVQPSQPIPTQRGDIPAERAEGEPGQRRRREVLSQVGPDDKRNRRGGNELPVSANFIRMCCKQEVIYQYHVEFAPPIESRHLRMKIFHDLKESALGTPEARAFEGRILYLPVQLPHKESVFRTKRPTDQSLVNIRVVFTNEESLVSCPAVYNILFKRIQACLHMVRVGRDFYQPENKFDLPQHKLELWPGYVSSVGRFEGGLLLCCDVSHKVIRKETVYDYIFEVQECTQGTGDFHTECANRLLGQVVLTPYNNRNYRIDDISWNMTVNDTFDRNGQPISFLRYFKETYNVTIKDQSQPMLISKPRKQDFPQGRKPRGAAQPEQPECERQICLVPELCYLTGLTDKMRKNFKLMVDLHGHTRVTPETRHRDMLKFVNNIRQNREATAILAAWKMEIEPDTVDLTGRRFAPEKVNFGGGKNCMAGDMADFKREMGNQRVISSLPINNWLVVCTERDHQTVVEFIKQMQRKGQTLGIQFGQPTVRKIHSDRSDLYTKVIKEEMNPNLQLVVGVFPVAREDRYNVFKRVCCVEHPVPSQAVISRTISDPRKLASVCVNIALQINVKLGGELWSIPVPIEKFMCVGIDVYHQGRGASRSQSVGGIVGSMNSHCTRWYSRCGFQMDGQEMMDVLTGYMVDMLKRYYNENHFLPDAIFIYRDGVGDGMLAEVQNREVPQFQAALRVFDPKYSPKIVFNVVQKRINARLFIRSRNQMDNPLPGTVVDHTITRANLYDFFLVPQSVRQGTVTPTHFVVLYDSSNYRPDQVQLMAFKMCHMYYNWPGTVRVPAPCLYAHKLAYLVGQNLKKEPGAGLWDRLFYL